MLRSSVTRNAALVLLCLTVVLTVDARILPARSKQVKVYSYVLPAGAEEIRDDISHSFACGNRSDGFYVDIDNDCQIFHRCQDKARFSFICAERTVFSQMYQTCVHDGQLGYPCEDSVQYYPEGEGYEPSAMEAGPESSVAEESPQPAAQSSAPAQELEAPQAAPSKASEIVLTKDEDNQNVVNEMAQENEPQSAADASDVMVKDEPEHQQEQEQFTQHQVNADLFDSIEEETDDLPAENTAQEVMDESDSPAAASVAATPTEEATATSQEDTQDIDVQEDDAGSTQPIVLASESFTATDATDAVADNSPSEAAISTPVQEATDASEPEPDASAASLLNAMQMVEELEPIVHDIPVENAENDNPQASASLVVDPTLPNVDASSSIEDNEVLPEMDAPSQANMDAAPLADTTVTDAIVPVAPAEELTMESNAENDAKVNELAPVADESSDKSEVIVSDDVSAATDSDEAEVADVKPTDEVEQSIVVEADDQPKAPALPERPLESPAIVEEMAPPRSHDSVELPELIVSTEFHLEAAAATQRPPIRRRKTFLFRADAIRSKHH